MTDQTIDVQVLDEAHSRKGGRLGRHVEHDPASRVFDIEAAGLLSGVRFSSTSWTRRAPILDQGDVGSCTGNAAAGWLGTDNAHRAGDASIEEADALRLYEEATRLDRVPGYYYPGDPKSEDTGSTGLAVAKALRNEGKAASYAHAFTLSGLIRALLIGPVLLGVPWFEGFDEPTRAGLVKVSGDIRGGHEILCIGVDVAYGSDAYGLDLSRTMFRMDNSWGTSWGDGGQFEWTAETWATLRGQSADATVPAPLG